MKKWPALMLDCETLSTRPNALILQLAALPFDPDAPHGEPCHGTAAYDVYLDWTQCEIEAKACDADIGTVRWWLETPSDEARFRLTHGVPRLDAMKAADELVCFINENLMKGADVWSYGATADIVWVRHFLRIAGYPDPWSYRSERCLRTVRALYPGLPARRPETPHDALSDAVAQARWLRDVCAPRTLAPSTNIVIDSDPVQRDPYVLALGGDS